MIWVFLPLWGVLAVLTGCFVADALRRPTHEPRALLLAETAERDARNAHLGIVEPWISRKACGASMHMTGWPTACKCGGKCGLCDRPHNICEVSRRLPFHHVLACHNVMGFTKQDICPVPDCGKMAVFCPSLRRHWAQVYYQAAQDHFIDQRPPPTSIPGPGELS